MSSRRFRQRICFLALEFNLKLTDRDDWWRSEQLPSQCWSEQRISPDLGRVDLNISRLMDHALCRRTMRRVSRTKETPLDSSSRTKQTPNALVVGRPSSYPKRFDWKPFMNIWTCVLRERIAWISIKSRLDWRGPEKIYWLTFFNLNFFQQYF